MHLNNLRTNINNVVVVAIGSIISHPVNSADQVSPMPLGVQYSVPSLGESTNPTPASMGGVGSTPSNLLSSLQLGSNGTVLTNASMLQYQTTTLPQTKIAPPAWAQSEFRSISAIRLQPFASNLFEGRFASTFSDAASNDYVLSPGDRIVIRIWGVRVYDDVLVVDQQGNIFIPEVGPVHVSGLTNSQLLSTVRSAISHIYTKNVQVYVNLQSAQPVAVYVTGFVNHPGRYAGGSMDSVLSFIDRAGGIDPERGSFRHIEIVRSGKVVSKLDLYSFALQGDVPQMRLKNGDVILVKERGVSVSAYGLLREEAQYEFSKPAVAKGSGLMELASPLKNVSHVSIMGTRNKEPYNKYFTIESFKNFKLADGDIVESVSYTHLTLPTKA